MGALRGFSSYPGKRTLNNQGSAGGRRQASTPPGFVKAYPFPLRQRQTVPFWRQLPSTIDCVFLHKSNSGK